MMKPASVKELKEDLSYRSQEELLHYCLRLAKFKKENKELLTYLLFDQDDEETYIRKVKVVIKTEFDNINARNYYFIKKRVRKILKEVKQYIRYSGKKETEVELLLFFCFQLKSISPSYENDKVLNNTFNRQLVQIRKRLEGLHEDLKYDYDQELRRLG